MIASLESEALLTAVREVETKGMEQLTLILERCSLSAEEQEAVTAVWTKLIGCDVKERVSPLPLSKANSMQSALSEVQEQ